MTTNPTSGAADLPEALRSIQRFEVVDCIDDKHVPAVIPKPHGPWVRYEDHIAALAGGQATAAQQPGAAGLIGALKDAQQAINSMKVEAETAAQGDALSDAVRVPLDSLHADAAYLIGRLREDSMPYARVIEIIRERIDAAKAAIRARAAKGDIPDVVDVPDQCPYFGPSPHRDVWLAGWYAARAAQEGNSHDN